ncbi:terminase large subunit [Yersinia phage vB_YenM_P744]
MSDTAYVKIPKKLVPVFTKHPLADFLGAWGGRGSAKTRTFAKMTAVQAYMFAENGVTGVILCGREYMESLKDSSMGEVKLAIESEPFLRDYFEIGETYIRTKNRRVSYVFAGLRLNLDSIKSKARILLAWVDEAEAVSDMAWNKLIPTVREEGYFPDGSYWKAQIWVTWNPELEGSATDKRFRQQADEDMCIVEMNYTDNEYFPQILERTRKRDQKNMDPSTYAWIWEGAYLENSNKQVIKRYRVSPFDDDLWEKADRLLFGADFGFADDPSTLLRGFILEDKLYIDYEAWGKHIELDDMWKFYAGDVEMTEKQALDWKMNDHKLYPGIPEVRRWPIKGDGSRPETISKLKKEGFNISAAKKWSGSIEDGIAHLNGFKEIVIHPRCRHLIEEVRKYSYKVDKNGDVLPIIVDAWNHCIDGIRYMLDGYITKKGRGMFE